MNKLNLFSIFFVMMSALTVNVSLAEEVQSAGNVSTSVENKIFTKERWGASYLNYMNGPTFSDSNGGSVNHFLTLKHKFNKKWALSLTARPDSNFGNGESSFVMSDPYVKLSYPTIYESERGVKVNGDLSYYAPVSAASKEAKLAGVVSPRLITSYEVGKFNFLYLLIPKVYLNSEKRDGQKTYSHAHYLSTGYKLSSLITLDFALYPAWTAKRGEKTSFNDLPAYPGMTFSFNKNFSFSPYVEVSALKPDSKTSSAGGVLNYTLL